MIPFILVLIAVGAFAEKNVFEDVVIALLFGALGGVMARLGWPRPPLLLGLVLGPLAENKLFLSTVPRRSTPRLARPHPLNPSPGQDFHPPHDLVVGTRRY